MSTKQVAVQLNKVKNQSICTYMKGISIVYISTTKLILEYGEDSYKVHVFAIIFIILVYIYSAL